MPQSTLLDDEIASHLAKLSAQQKQMVLVVLKTMSEQNSKAEMAPVSKDGLEREKD